MSLTISILAVMVEFAEKEIEGFQAEQDESRSGCGEDVHPTATGQTDGSRHPYTGGRCQSANGILLEDDGSGTDETDARHHLCRHTRYVKAMVGRVSGTSEAVGRHNHKECRAQGYEEVCAEPCSLVAVFALQSDGTAKDGRDEYPEYEF